MALDAQDGLEMDRKTLHAVPRDRKNHRLKLKQTKTVAWLISSLLDLHKGLRAAQFLKKKNAPRHATTISPLSRHATAVPRLSRQDFYRTPDSGDPVQKLWLSWFAFLLAGFLLLLALLMLLDAALVLLVAALMLSVASLVSLVWCWWMLPVRCKNKG